MPSSIPDHIPAVLKHVQKLKPKSVLDVGVGYGKWGFLLREYLEAWENRVHPSDWEVTITGVEVWGPYTKLPWQRELYTNMLCQDVRELDLADLRASFDVAICGDVLEHMPKEDALKVLGRLLDQCKEVIVNVPIGKAWLDNVVVDGNPHEKHRSSWEKADLGNYDFPRTEGRMLHSCTVGGREVATFALKRTQKEKAPVQSDCTPASRKNTVLHVHNVQRPGGTGNFVWDFARTFPEFHHVALAVNDPDGDPDWLNWVSHDLRPLYAPKLTRAHIDEFDPVCVLLHNTSGKSVDCDHHLGILHDRFTIFVHHNPTRPLFETNVDVDVFVSEYVLLKYSSIVSRMKAHRLIPPCVKDLGRFGSVSVPSFRDLKLTAAGKAGPDFLKAMPKIGHRVHLGPPRRGMGVMQDYLRSYNTAVVWSGKDESWCRTVTECMATGMVVVAHDIGAIPEQITHGKTGFLFKDEAGLMDVLNQLTVHWVPGALELIGKNAREWALANAGPVRMKAAYYPLLMKALMQRGA